MTRRWTFVRHGQSVANAEGWLAGQIDTELTPLGRAQAEQTRAALADVVLDRAFSSDLVRAHETAQIILADHDGVPLRTTAALRERECGQWRRRRIDDLQPGPEYDRALRGWHSRPPGGESLHEVAHRAITWLGSVDTHDGPTLVVAHGALIRAVIGALDGLPYDEIGQWRPRNCEVVDRDLDPGAWDDVLRRIGPPAEPG